MNGRKRSYNLLCQSLEEANNWCTVLTEVKIYTVDEQHLIACHYVYVAFEAS